MKFYKIGKYDYKFHENVKYKLRFAWINTTVQNENLRCNWIANIYAFIELFKKRERQEFAYYTKICRSIKDTVLVRI